MKRWFAACAILAGQFLFSSNSEARPEGAKKVYIIPIRDDIMPPLVYVVRRGVKEAMENHADAIILDMETNGGRVDVTEKIIEILNQFPGETVTYVNRNAYSAGAFISVATQKIYMAPQSVIGAAAPIMLSPTGGGVQEMPTTVEVKMTSAISAKVRTYAQKNGHNPEVVEAMIDKTKELEIDGHVINKKGQILTLTNTEAEEEYGAPPKPLLSLGTVSSLDALLEKLGYANSERKQIIPTGAERIGIWINTISPLLLIIGIIGVYIEFKTPGFGLPGIVGILAFAIYFFGGYIAGLSGIEWVAIFIVGLALVALELLAFPGTLALGLSGAALMFVALVMAMVDIYPGGPRIPSFPQLQAPLQNLGLGILGAGIVAGVLARFLPKTPLYHALVSHSASGVQSVLAQDTALESRRGQVGTTISVLRPGGKAQFGDDILDVVSQGDMVGKGQKVRIIGRSGSDAVVETA